MDTWWHRRLGDQSGNPDVFFFFFWRLLCLFRAGVAVHASQAVHFDSLRSFTLLSNMEENLWVVLKDRHFEVPIKKRCWISEVHPHKRYGSVPWPLQLQVRLCHSSFQNCVFVSADTYPDVALATGCVGTWDVEVLHGRKRVKKRVCNAICC